MPPPFREKLADTKRTMRLHNAKLVADSDMKRHT